MTWVHDVNYSLVWKEKININPFKTRNITFPVIVHIAEEVDECFGCSQDLECQEMKEALVAMENEGPVSLSKFHEHSFDGGWQFSESYAYLCHLGALDETHPKRPTLVIPNCLFVRSNCIVSLRLYIICRIDQFEELLAQLENKITGPGQGRGGNSLCLCIL